MIEYGEKKRAYAQVIPDKKASTIVPILTNTICSNSTIWTDEHGAYRSLSSLFEDHKTVCHKYEFVNILDGVHTQAIESFHSEMKREIRARKDVKADQRPEFLKKFCFYWNNRSCFFEACLKVIKLR